MLKIKKMNTLEEVIIKKITKNGPISLEKFMELCLYDKFLGYYSNKNPLGTQGDYITSPEISQMFGELIGLWLLQVWYDQNLPNKFNLVELGPGNGTLMKDILRATSIDPRFEKSAKISLIEKSRVLQLRQSKKLISHKIYWPKNLKKIEDLPLFIIGNEFFDALPIRQFKKDNKGWLEKYIYINKKSKLDFLFKKNLKKTSIVDFPKNFKNGTIFEKSEMSLNYIKEISKKIEAFGGVGLFIDYGHFGTSGDSLQAILNHKFSNPLENLGKSDLSSNVNFQELSQEACKKKIRVAKIKTQGDFLKSLGIEFRCSELKVKLNRTERRNLDISMNRLIDNAQMGTTFKVLGFTNSDSPKLPILEK